MPKGKSKYVDGFVLVVPQKNVPAYKRMARDGAKVWKKHGALAYRECLLEEAKPMFAQLIFPKLTKAKKSETIWFSYIEYKSKRHRNQVNRDVMKELSGEYGDAGAKEMPFDMKRMAWGGFRVEEGY